MSFVGNTTDLPCRDFLSPEFGTSSRAKKPSFLEISIFSYSTVWDRLEGRFRAKNQLDSSSCFDTLPACDGQIDRRTDGQTHDDSKYRASIASRGKTRGVFDVDCVYGNYVMH